MRAGWDQGTVKEIEANVVWQARNGRAAGLLSWHPPASPGSHVSANALQCPAAETAPAPTCHERLVVHAQLSQDAGHLHWVSDERLAALAPLPRVCIVCQRQRLAHLPSKQPKQAAAGAEV